MKKIKLGMKAKDTVTGFTGIVIARTTYLHGCARLQLQDVNLNKDGLPIEPQVFDELQLEVIEKTAVKPSTKEERVTGGPRQDSLTIR